MQILSPLPDLLNQKHSSWSSCNRVLRRLTGDLMPAATLPGLSLISPTPLPPHEAWFPCVLHQPP